MGDLNRNSVQYIAVKWTGTFFIIGAITIYVTDLVLDLYIVDNSLYPTYQTYKELVFFGIASLVFYWITRQLLDRLKRNSESMHYALKAGKLATWDYDIATGESRRSENHHTLYGYEEPVKHWSVEEFLNHIPEEDREQLEKEILNVAEGNGEVNKEIRVKKKNGELAWRWLKGKVQYKENGEVDRVLGVTMDIDDQKKAEKQLQNKEHFVETAINSVPGIFYMLDEEGCLVRWNKNFNKVFGLSDAQLSGLYGVELVVAHDRNKAKKELQKVQEQGYTQADLTLKTEAEGNSIYTITASRFQSEGKEFVVATGIDVTQERALEHEIDQILKEERKERKQAELDRERLESMVEQAPSAICIMEGPNHRFIYANEAYKEIVGADQLIGKSINEVMPELAEQGYLNLLDHIYESGETYRADEAPVKIDKGEGEAEEYIFNLFYKPLFDENDQVYGIFANGVDVTEQVRSREKIHQQNYQLQSAQDIAALGYWEYNRQTNELKWTDMVYKLLGLDKESFELNLKNFLEYVHPDDQQKVLTGQEWLIETGQVETEYRVYREDGSLGWFRETGEVYEWDGDAPRILHGIVMDITQQKETEWAIKKSHIEGENKERKRIANELHDSIAQSLSAALLHFDSVDDQLGNLSPEQAEQLRSARKLIKTSVNETRTIARNLMPKAIEDHGLQSAVRSLAKQYQLSTDIDFELDLQNEEHQLDQDIEVNLYRIMQELLSNAIRHSECSKVWIGVYHKDNTLLCIIEDNGVGKNMNQIVQEEGFGLRSVKSRVQFLAGSMDFDNEKAEGTKVMLKIPTTEGT